MCFLSSVSPLHSVLPLEENVICDLTMVGGVSVSPATEVHMAPCALIGWGLVNPSSWPLVSLVLHWTAFLAGRLLVFILGILTCIPNNTFCIFLLTLYCVWWMKFSFLTHIYFSLPFSVTYAYCMFSHSSLGYSNGGGAVMLSLTLSLSH